MLTMKENPALFSLVKKTLKDEHKINVFNDYINDRSLAEIDRLDNSIKGIDRNLTTLDGIEKLPNLFSLSIYGGNEHKIKGMAGMEVAGQISSAVKDTSIGAENIVNEIMERVSGKVKKIFSQGQIKDFSPIKKCDNLSSLCIYSQRKVEEIDVSNNKNLFLLYMMDCPNVKRIIGLDKIKLEDSRNIINFRDCPNIRNIVNFDKFAKKALSSKRDISVTLPVNYFCQMANFNKELMQDEEFLSSTKFIWTEGSLAGGLSTMQMKIFKEKIDNVIKTIVDKDDSDIVKISKVYRWICDNFTYDHELLDRQTELTKKKNRTLEDNKEKSNVSYVLRSAKDVFERKKGVCLGFARLLNFMLLDMGFEAREVFCNIHNGKISREFLIHDHAVSEVKINGKSYFMDPTFDIGKEKSKYFMLNKKEMEYTHHILGMWENESTENTPSIQSDLLNAGILYDKFSVGQDSIEKNVYKEMLGIEMESFL